MKKSLVLLAGASMAFLGLPAVSHAQAASGPFADVPTDHWAYQSVDTLQKAGIVIGYPDGTYGGRRPMTRYEFAVAIARLLAQMKPGVTAADLASLRSDLEGRIAGNTAAIDALRSLVNGFQTELTRLGVDVAAADARLDSLEARMGAVEGRLNRDEGVLGYLVGEDARIKINGEVNLFARGDASRRQNGTGVYVPFLDKNGVYQGGTFGASDRLLQTSDVYHDILLKVRGKLSDTATANVDLDFGNYLSQVGNTAAFPGYPTNGVGGNFLTPGALNPGSTNGVQNQYANVYKAYLDAAVKLGPLGGAELLVGRFGNQYTKWTLKQAEADVYGSTTQTSSGDILGDGIAANIKVGPAKVNGFAIYDKGIQFSQIYGGTTGTTLVPQVAGNPFPSTTFQTASGGAVQTRPGGLIRSNHAAAIDDAAGARATFGAPEGAVLGVTFEEFGLRNNGTNGLGPFDGINDPNRLDNRTQYNRLTVYGLDFNGGLPFGVPGVKKGGILVDAAYTVSAHGFNNNINNVGQGWRYTAEDYNLGFSVGGVHLKGGYQYIGPDFSAPGYWGKVGAWTNPTNVMGPTASLKYAFTPKLSLNADAEFYKAAYGTDKLGNPVDSPIHGAVDYTDGSGTHKGGADHLNRYQAGLGYGLSSTYGVDLGYEAVQYDIRDQNGATGLAGGHPTESYVNIGVGHTISNNTSIKLLYQIVHYDDAHTGFDPISAPTGGKSDGSVASAQFQLKF